MAAHYVAGLRHFAMPMNINIIQANASPCPPIFDFDVPSNRNCRGFMDGIRSMIKDTPPEAVMLSASWTEYASLFGDEYLLQSLKRTIRELRESGIKVVLFGPSIFYKQSLPQLLVPYVLVGNGRFPSSKYLKPEIFKIDERMSREFSNMDGVHFTSILQTICPGHECPPVIESGELLQFDNAHLTVEGSIFVVRRVFPAIAAELASRRYEASAASPIEKSRLVPAE